MNPNSSIIVVDASVALKWFFPEEKQRDLALDVLDTIASAPERFAVPELFFVEVLSVLCRATGASVEEKQDYLHQLELLGFHRVGNGHELLSLAVKLAHQWNLTGYDAIYVATAKLLGGTWLSADEKAVKRVKEHGLSLKLSQWTQ